MNDFLLTKHTRFAAGNGLVKEGLNGGLLQLETQ
jgi:hypothetical protein